VLLESEREKFAMLFETAPVGYVILDELGVIQKINKQGVHLLQRTESTAMIGKNFSTFITEDSHCSYYALLREITPMDSHAQREIRILTHDGTICFLQIDATRVKDISDNKYHYFITLTDIAMLKKIEHNLKQPSTRLNQTLEASETGIWMVNLFNKRIYFDAYGMRIL